MLYDGCLLVEEPCYFKSVNSIEHINLVQLLGKLEKTPEFIAHHQDKLVRLTLITEEGNGKKEEKNSNMQRHILTAWGKQADFAATYLTKGQLIYAEGRLVHNSFQDKQGYKRIITEVKVKVLKVVAS